ncbi:unnamed protein product, partial [Urochloa humidicola]
MLATKRCGDILTRSSDESKRTRPFVSGDSNWYPDEGIWSGLGKEGVLRLSKSVVSLALSDGDTVLFSCSGIAIRFMINATSFLTSASLVRAFESYKDKIHNNLKIEVRHEGEVATGFLKESDLDLEIAIVQINSSFDVHPVFLYHWTQFMPYCDVVSLGRDISGKLTAITGKLTCDSSGSKESECLMFSSCKLSEVWEGGPLFSYAGKFVGMNLVPSMKKSFFLPTSLIIERLQHFWTSLDRNAFLTRVKDLKKLRVGELTDDTDDSQPEGAPNKDHLKVLGYPKPTGSGMTLAYTFEDYFGDVYHNGVWKDVHYNGVWKKLGKRVCQKIRRSVVSLASFTGDTRYFACSGIFIDWDSKCRDNECQIILTSASLVRNPDYPDDDGDKIVEGLRIEVRHRSNRGRREGKLMHYNLHYNVALVSVQKFCAVPQAISKHGSLICSSKLVAAVGRCFKSSDLMASSGQLVPSWSGPFDCKKLRYSTCRITKAGIGGLLVDYDGKFVGMNFYDPKVGTPFLFCDDIVDILDCFKKRTGAEIDSFRVDGDDTVFMNSWPVPLPHWRCPGDPDCFSEHERNVLASDRKFKYCDGDILVCRIEVVRRLEEHVGSVWGRTYGSAWRNRTGRRWRLFISGGCRRDPLPLVCGGRLDHDPVPFLLKGTMYLCFYPFQWLQAHNKLHAFAFFNHLDSLTQIS